MRRWMIGLLLICVIVVTACGKSSDSSEVAETNVEQSEETNTPSDIVNEPDQPDNTSEIEETDTPPSNTDNTEAPSIDSGEPATENESDSNSSSNQHSQTPSNTENTDAGNKPADNNETPAAQEPTEKPATITVAQVKQKYEDQLIQLKGLYLSELESQFNDVVAAKKAGQANNEIYAVYSKKAVQLKEDSQAKVNQILFQMRSELTKNKLPKESVDELRSRFYNEVDQVEADYTKKTKEQLDLQS